MRNLLKEYHIAGRTFSFLVPAVTNPLRGRVEYIEVERVSILAGYLGEEIRIVTHPNNIVLLERTAREPVRCVSVIESR